MAIIPLLFSIDTIEHIKEFSKDMTRTATEVSTAEVFHIFKLEDRMLSLALLYKIFHVVAEVRIWIVVQIDTTKGILHHVLHNPVRCEYLSSGRNILCTPFAKIEHFVLTLRDVELVEPANEFCLLIIFRSNIICIIKHIHETVFRQDVAWQKQFGIVINTSKYLAQDRSRFTESRNQDGELLGCFGVITQ